MIIDPTDESISMRLARKAYSLFAVAAIWLVGCSPDSAREPALSSPASVEIFAEPVVFKSDSDSVEAVGTSRAIQTATIFSEAPGEVTFVGFVSGQRVEAGKILARLESRREALDVQSAEIAVKDARQLLARYERIDVPGAISDSQVDAAQTALAAAEVQLELAQDRLLERTIRAPFAGYVGLADIDPGVRITPQTEITRLDDRSFLFVDFEAPEQVFGQVSTGDMIAVQPFASQQALIDAEVVAIASRIDPERRSFTVRVSIDNEDDRLRPGMSFRVQFNLPGRAYPSVPEAALIWGGDGAYVWGVADGKAKRFPVTVISRDGGTVLVRSDLQEGDLIIAEGVQKVREGTLVKDVRPTAADAPAAAAPGGAQLNGQP